MVRHKLGKWNLDELAKNPNRAIIDKKLARIESDSKRFEKIKKSLNPKISSEKFLDAINFATKGLNLLSCEILSIILFSTCLSLHTLLETEIMKLNFLFFL